MDSGEWDGFSEVAGEARRGNLVVGDDYLSEENWDALQVYRG